ncbi:MAG TPA: FHA domain-containing protein [Ktedonobacterales bacterium]|jgi:hypothetical protein
MLPDVNSIGPFGFLFILRIALVVLLYLVILQVVAVARRDLRRAAAAPAGAPRSGTVVGHLVVIDSGSTPLVPGSRLALDPLTTIGREPTSTIVLDSNFVSGQNTRIYFKDKSLWVEDLGGKNGTVVNGQRIQAPIAITPNSEVQVGDVRFKVTP